MTPARAFFSIFGIHVTEHGRSVTEIWGRGEMKNADIGGGGGETKNLDLLGDDTSNMAMYTQKAKKIAI